MATIGSISVAFTANLRGLESGIEEAIDLFDDLSEASESLSSQLSSLEKSRATVRVDASELESAIAGVADLKKAAESASPTIKTSVDSSEVEKASGSLEGLEESLAAASQAASQSRGSIASVVVASARLSASVSVVASTYASLRNRTLEYIQSISGARTATQATAVVTAAMRGNYEATRIVLSSVGQAATGMVRELFTVEGVSRAISSAIGGLLNSLGMTDQALVSSIQHFTQLSVSQASSAAVYRVYQRSIQSINQAIDTSATAIARFVTSNETARAVTNGAATAFQSVLRAVQPLNNAFNVASARVSMIVRDFNVAGAVSATVGDAFDAVRNAVVGLASGSTTLPQVFSRVSAAFAAIVPSGAAVSSTISAVGSRAAALAGGLGRLFEAFTFIRKGADATAGGFMSLVAKTIATNAAIGAAAGGISAWATGASVAAGASAGAAGALSTLASVFPITASLAIAAAVATGRFSEQLMHLGREAQQVEQMSERFGAPRKEIEKLRLAAENTGVGMSQLAKGQQTFYTSLSKIKAGQLNVENVREAKLAFDSLGISLEEVKSRDPSQVFAIVAEELQKVEDPAKRTQIAFDLFGKQGAAILPALKEFGELAADFDRLGGSIAEVDFNRFKSVEQSFDRIGAASKNLGATLLVPFVELQTAFNNLGAEIRGGFTAAIAPIATLIADATKPFAVMIEVAGRVVNILLRMVGVATTLIAGFSGLSSIARIFQGIKDGIFTALAPVENLITALQSVADTVTNQLGFLSEVFQGIGFAIGLVVGGVIQLVTYVALGAVAWAVYSAAVAVATGFSIAATVSFIAMWAAALGPIALIVVGLAVIGAGISFLIAGVVAFIKWLIKWAQYFGLVSKEGEKINASTASVEELAAAAEHAAAATSRIGDGLKSAIEAVPGGQGLSDLLFGKSPSADEFAASISKARDGIAGLTIESARFGEAGAAAAAAAQNGLDDLQKALATKAIDLPTFDKESEKLRQNLEKNLEILRDDSPEITLKKNLELFKQLDGAAKAASKSVRDIGAGVQIGDKFFPRSDEVKARAAQFKDEYVAALEEVKKKQQAGGFGRELKVKREKNQADLDAGRISTEQFEKVKLELDSTSAQEQASIAAEEVQREFERKELKLKADLSFADSIRKELETAFLSPIEKFEKELKKIRENPELKQSEKFSAELNLKKKQREDLVGKDAQTNLQERSRDLKQGVEAGLITDNSFNAEMKKATEDFAKAVGVAETPFGAFSQSVDNIAKQFGFVGQPLDQVREKLKGNAAQLAVFDEAVKQARDNLLQSLGIEKSPEEVFQEQMKKIAEAANSTDPNKRITPEQKSQAEDVARRKRNADLGAGDDVGGQLRDRKRKVEEAFGDGKDNARLRIASNKIDIDRRQAAGLDVKPSQALAAGIDKVNDAFGVTGKTMAEIQDNLGPEKFAEHQEAIEKSRDSVLEGLGVEKSGVQQLQELRDKLKDAKASVEETSHAMKKATDNFMQSIGVTKTPFENFSSQIDNIAAKFGMAGQPLDTVREKLKGNADQLALFDRAVKEARDNLLSSLGIEKTPQEVFNEQMKKIDEAANATDPNKKISDDQAKQARLNATRKRDEALGADTANNRASKAAEQRRNIEQAFGKNGENNKEAFDSAMENLKKSMPGSSPESPVKKFQDSMKELNYLKGSGALGAGDEAEKEFAQRKLELQAQLQEDIKPALEKVSPDRRAVESADTRSKEGVDTFFRILRGNDNPSLKAQLEIARNTRDLAAAAKDKDAAPVIAQLAAH